MGDLAAGWRECETPSGVKYYYNSSKNECRWVRPVDKEGDGAEDDDQVQDVTERMLSAKKRKLESEMVDVSGSAAVEDLCSERVALQSRLSCKDAILDPGVKVWMRDWIRRDGSADRDVDHLIEMLSSGYEGYGEYVGMLVRWLDMLGNCGEKAVEDHFKTLVLAQFNAVKFEGEMSTHKDTPPKWLVGMLSNPVWRGLLINLAEKQQERRETSPLLDFAVKAICKAGHHAEVAAVLNTASYFAVFRRTFTDTLYGILDFEGDNERNPADLSKLEEKFRDLCCFSQYTYLFAMEALELLEESELKGDLFRSKVRRLRQGLANTPRKQDSRLEAIQLSNPINRRNEGGLSATALSGGFPELASIVRTCISNRTFPPETLASLREMYLSSTVPVWPVRRVEFLTLLTQHLYDPYREMTTQARQDGCYILSVACARGSNREQETFTAIESSVDIVKDSETMAVAEITHQSERMKKLAKMVKEYPPVACGVIRFARSCFLSSRFQKESCFSVGVRTLLSLIRCAVRTHPLQRVMAFFYHLPLAANLPHKCIFCPSVRIKTVHD
mmetsp:Transcript_20777/g.45385  ORF Transcript_20777/g.45385 Transcript_20777/m.45385 type:complete len:559 (-) Transcript_20777:818-2494(-)